MSRRFRPALPAAMVLAVTVGACATPTPYAGNGVYLAIFRPFVPTPGSGDVVALTVPIAGMAHSSMGHREAPSSVALSATAWSAAAFAVRIDTARRCGEAYQLHHYPTHGDLASSRVGSVASTDLPHYGYAAILDEKSRVLQSFSFKASPYMFPFCSGRGNVASISPNGVSALNGKTIRTGDAATFGDLRLGQ